MSVVAESTLIERATHLLCDPQSRQFSRPYHDGESLYVTDGRMILAFGDIEPPDGLAIHRKIDGEWKLDDGHRKPPERSGELLQGVVTGILSVPTVDGPPEDVNAIWERMSECIVCHGEKYLECDMGHQHDCSECEGDGEYLQYCDEAGEAVEILSNDFARRYVWIMGQLPGVRICPHMFEHMLGFTFDGGRGGLMALKKED